MRYAVVNTKGGVGKTTMACHLAAHLASVSKTLLIDGDTQESAATWAAWRRDSAQFSILPSPNTVRLKGKAISVEGLELSAAFENTVVDASPDRAEHSAGEGRARLRAAGALPGSRASGHRVDRRCRRRRPAQAGDMARIVPAPRAPLRSGCLVRLRLGRRIPRRRQGQVTHRRHPPTAGSLAPKARIETRSIRRAGFDTRRLRRRYSTGGTRSGTGVTRRPGTPP